jgi:hypothetical protein
LIGIKSCTARRELHWLHQLPAHDPEPERRRQVEEALSLGEEEQIDFVLIERRPRCPRPVSFSVWFFIRPNPPNGAWTRLPVGSGLGLFIGNKYVTPPHACRHALPIFRNPLTHVTETVTA